jgi:hypothetical protein
MSDPTRPTRKADTDPAFCGFCDHHADRHDYGRTVDEHHSVPCADCPGGVCDRTPGGAR